MKFFSYFILLCFIVISVSFCIYFSLLYENEKVDYINDVTSQLNAIFEKLDKNNDGYLDIDEFSSFKNNYRIFMHKQEEDVNFEVISIIPAFKVFCGKRGDNNYSGKQC